MYRLRILVPTAQLGQDLILFHLRYFCYEMEGRKVIVHTRKKTPNSLEGLLIPDRYYHQKGRRFLSRVMWGWLALCLFVDMLVINKNRA